MIFLQPLQLLRPSVCNKENENSTGTSLSNGKRKNIGDKVLYYIVEQ
jgi:hypothetical protein